MSEGDVRELMRSQLSQLTPDTLAHTIVDATQRKGVLRQCTERWGDLEPDPPEIDSTWDDTLLRIVERWKAHQWEEKIEAARERLIKRSRVHIQMAIAGAHSEMKAMEIAIEEGEKLLDEWGVVADEGALEEFPDAWELMEMQGLVGFEVNESCGDVGEFAES